MRHPAVGETDPSAEVRPSMTPPFSKHRKRSATVSLALVAGAGTTALVLGQVDPTQREEDVLVYPGPDACVSAAIRTEADCRRDYAIVRQAYPEAAPRYGSLPECEAHHGPAHCLTGAVVAASATGRFVPMLAGYLLGRRPDQGLPPQPIYHHRPEQAAHAHAGHGGYCTSWGGRVVTASGGTSSSARVASSAVRQASFGGFGRTGRGFSSHGSSGHGGG